MKAGRELDAKIATEVMGWQSAAADGVWVTAQEWFRGAGSVAPRELLFCPSVGDASAGLVIDRLANKGLAVTVYTGIYRSQGVKCRCCIMRGPHDLDSGGIAVVADTRPLAICEAALEAKVRGWI